MQLTGIHHVTAVTGNPSQNVAFYTQVLGLRLVKKTVNQDDLSAYHLFYGDEVGSAGTEMTFFDWPHAGPVQPGTETIAPIAFRVPGRAALDWWARRLSDYGVSHSGIGDFAGRAILSFADPEGQRLMLVDDGGAPGGTPWAGSPVPADMAIRGLHGVSLTVRQRAPTARFLTEVLGFRQVGEFVDPDTPARSVVVFTTGAGGPGTEVYVEERPDAPRGRVGIGGVHHVALRTPNDGEQQQWRERIWRMGFQVTTVIDRYYFKSIYFPVPGGMLFEIATDGPGFATDEDVAHLGERLALPPFLESRREQIEAGLRPITPTQFSRVS